MPDHLRVAPTSGHLLYRPSDGHLVYLCGLLGCTTPTTRLRLTGISTIQVLSDCLIQTNGPEFTYTSFTVGALDAGRSGNHSGGATLPDTLDLTGAVPTGAWTSSYAPVPAFAHITHFGQLTCCSFTYDGCQDFGAELQLELQVRKLTSDDSYELSIRHPVSNWFFFYGKARCPEGPYVNEITAWSFYQELTTDENGLMTGIVTFGKNGIITGEFI